MGVGRAFWKSGLPQIPDTFPYKARLIDFIDKLGPNLVDGRGFVFHGPQSTGKTSAAVILAKAAVSFNHTFTQLSNKAYMIAVPEAVAIYQSADWDTKSEFMEHLDEVDVLVFDGLGAEWNTAFSFYVVDNIIRARLSAGRSIIITTGLTELEMIDRYKPPLINAIMGKCEHIGFTHSWADLERT